MSAFRATSDIATSVDVWMPSVIQGIKMEPRTWSKSSTDSLNLDKVFGPILVDESSRISYSTAKMTEFENTPARRRLSRISAGPPDHGPKKIFRRGESQTCGLSA